MQRANSGRNGKVRKLNKEAHKIVDANAVEIINSLLVKTLEGHVLSARMLVGLAEKNVEAEEAMEMRPLRSMASEWGAERPWPGEVDEATAETCFGSREPEV